MKQGHIWGVETRAIRVSGVVGERYVAEDIVDAREEVVVASGLEKELVVAQDVF
jgi:hypothetical protein